MIAPLSTRICLFFSLLSGAAYPSIARAGEVAGIRLAPAPSDAPCLSGQPGLGDGPALGDGPGGAGMRLSLDGTWEYRLDPDDQGLSEKWYRQHFRPEGTLQFPGTLDDAGIGTKPQLNAERVTREVMLHLTRRHEYVGVAWYRKEVVIPADWDNRNVRLFLERALWKTTLWVDGKEAGSRESLNTPHEYELGTLLTPGKHVLVLRIDNSKQYDISYRDMAHAYTNETQIMWNGLLGNLYLEAVPAVSIGSVQVFPDVDKRALTAELKLQNETPRTARARLTLTVLSGAVAVQQKEIAVSLSPGATGKQLMLELGPGAELWDEFNPHLYTLRVALSSGSSTQTKEVKFGLRELQAQRERLLLNGRRLFLRGTLECSIFPLAGHPPMDKQGWIKVFNAARAYGLNHLRFHSWSPPKAAFEVADSLGFYLQAELPLWVLNFGEDTATVRFIREEAERMRDAYGNHPSFCFWSLGNELQGDFGLIKSLTGDLKATDPRRLYSTTTFTFQEGHGAWPEAEDDFFVTQWTKKGWVRGQGIFNNRYPDFQTDYSFAIDSMPVPIITHEIGQYSVYPNLAEIEKYTGVLEPLNFMAVRNDLRRKGLLEYADEFTLASGKLAVLLYKEEIERALKTRGVSGFQLLDLHDFPGQGTALVGILDAFWESKGLIAPEAFRRFCSPVVPLLRFPKAVYTSDESFEAQAELFNYSSRELTQLEAVWSISPADEPGARPIGSGKLTLTSAPSGSLTALGTIRAPLDKVSRATRLNVRVRIPGTDYENEWPIWVYPPALPDPAPEPVFTRSVDEALTLLSQGKKVLFNPDTSQLQGVDGRFTQVFWSPVHFPDQPGTMGLLCDPGHPALADFPTDFHTNWQWWDLIMHSKSLVIDSLPPMEPLVRVIDNFFKNRKMALVLEAQVGPGSLIICAADIAQDLEKRPVARQLRHSLLNYMQGREFRPRTRLTEEDMLTLIKDH